MSFEKNPFPENNSHLLPPSLERNLSPMEKSFYGLSQDLLRDENRKSHTLSDEQPGTRLRMQTIDGITEFTVNPWPNQSEIHPNNLVYTSVHRSDGGAMRCIEAQIWGASEGQAMSLEEIGKIKQYGDLVITKLHREPLWKEDYELPDERFQEMIAKGFIIPTVQAGPLRLVRGETVVVPCIISLQRVDPQTGNELEVIFDIPAKE